MCRIVESVGEEVNEVEAGDFVIPVFIADCGECKDCKSSESNLCSKFPFTVSPWMPREESSRFTDLKGETLFHFLFVSSFSQYTVVDIAHLTKLDHSIPPNRACLLSCGVSTGKFYLDPCFIFFWPSPYVFLHIYVVCRTYLECFRMCFLYLNFRTPFNLLKLI